jgi:Protein of unknown function (DUF3000)
VSSLDQVPADFLFALGTLRQARCRSELHLDEIPAPSRLAPFAVALGAEVIGPGGANGAVHGPAAAALAPASGGEDVELATGRFILLHDPEEPDAWGGAFRIVCFAQAPLETDIGLDPFLADVAWSWLVDALDARGARYIAASGTATKILSTGFGELARQGDGAQIELRASWTPLDAAIGPHVEGWGELLCMLAGLPPRSEGVTVLPRRRSNRG